MNYKLYLNLNYLEIKNIETEMFKIKPELFQFISNPDILKIRIKLVIFKI